MLCLQTGELQRITRHWEGSYDCGFFLRHGRGKERGEERSPDRWMVVLLNDDYTPFDWVIDVLIRIFERTPVDAMTVTRSVHQQGRGIAGVYPRVKALRLVAKCMSEARRDGYPFTCIAVPAEGGGLSL
ncbi:MAG: ATP-dependent Clp protease adaptor ClpS [Sutterella wadsworthensis]